MTKHYSASGLLFFLLLIGCGTSSGPTDTPMFQSAPISPGTKLTVFIRTELGGAGPGMEILSSGEPVEETLTICGITMNYSTDVVVAPRFSTLAGATGRRLDTAIPLPPGTRLLLGDRNFCGGATVMIFEATVIRSAE
jgi:hypothetical protein